MVVCLIHKELAPGVIYTVLRSEHKVWGSRYEVLVPVCVFYKELAPGERDLHGFELRVRGFGPRVRGFGASSRILRGIGARGA